MGESVLELGAHVYLSPSSQRICNRDISVLVNRGGSSPPIRWCDQSVRVMKQELARYQLTPRDVASKMHLVVGASTCSVLQAICVKLHAYFPASPQHTAVVQPRIVSKLRAILRQLDRDGVVCVYALPFGMGSAVYYPAYTQAWPSGESLFHPLLLLPCCGFLPQGGRPGSCLASSSAHSLSFDSRPTPLPSLAADGFEKLG